jgi:hypothetical protein
MTAELVPEAVESLDLLAGLLAASGRYVDAARLFAAADAQRRRMGCIRPSLLELLYADDLGAVRAALGTSAYEAPAPRARR